MRLCEEFRDAWHEGVANSWREQDLQVFFLFMDGGIGCPHLPKGIIQIF